MIQESLCVGIILIYLSMFVLRMPVADDHGNYRWVFRGTVLSFIQFFRLGVLRRLQKGEDK